MKRLNLIFFNNSAELDTHTITVVLGSLQAISCIDDNQYPDGHECDCECLYPWLFLLPAVNPVPRILLANATNIQVMDVDSTHNVHVIVTGTSPLAVTYLQMSQDERVFWVDYGGRLWQFSAEGRKKVETAHHCLRTDFWAGFLERKTYAEITCISVTFVSVFDFLW